MSKTPELVTATEIALTFGGFKNIDLFSQGIYQIRLRATNEHSRRPCLPFAFEEVEESLHLPPTDGSYLPAHVINETAEFCMPSFRVRYCEQEIKMSTVVRFRTDLSVESIRSAQAGMAADAQLGLSALDHASASDSQLVLEPVLLEIRLMHARSSLRLDSGADPVKQSRTLFKQVAVQTLRLCVPVRGGSAFFPITFDEWHFCYAPLLTHSAIVCSKVITPPQSGHSRVAIAPAPLSSSKRFSRRLGGGPQRAQGDRQSQGDGRGPACNRQSYGDPGEEGSAPMRLLEDLAESKNHSQAGPGHWFRKANERGQAAAVAAAASPNTALAHLLSLALSPPGEAELMNSQANAVVLRVALCALAAHVRTLIWSHTMLMGRLQQLEVSGVQKSGAGESTGLLDNSEQPCVGGPQCANTVRPGSIARLSRALDDAIAARSNSAVESPSSLELLPPHMPEGVELLASASFQASSMAESSCHHVGTSARTAVSHGGPTTGTAVSGAHLQVRPTEAIVIDSIDTSQTSHVMQTSRLEAADISTPPVGQGGHEETIHRTARRSKQHLPSAAQLEAASTAADEISARVRLRMGHRIPGLWPDESADALAPPLHSHTGTYSSAGRTRRVEYVAGIDAVRLGREALGILNSLSTQVWCVWQAYLTAAEDRPGEIITELSDHYLDMRAERFGESHFRETRLFEQRAYTPMSGASQFQPTAIARSLRASAYYRSLPPLPLSEVPRDTQSDNQCVFMEQWHSIKYDVPPEQRSLADEIVGCNASFTSYTHGRGPEVESLRNLPATAVPRPYNDPLKAPRLRLSWMSNSSTAVSENSVHLYIFVHGFQGSSLDLRGFRNHMALLLPDKDNARFLMSSSNEEFTATSSFERLGENLAREVINFIRAEAIESMISRVSFICHSFGSIIARTALRKPQLEPLLPMLYTYISLSGPHLGMLYSSNLLVELGVWGLRKWKHAQCLTELSLKDAKEPSNTFLYRLSKGDALSRFTNVILVSSAEDRYVPHHSARIQLCPEAMHDSRFGSAFVSMVHNILAPLSCANLIHVDVAFVQTASSRLAHQLDLAIGRKAHIDFLEQQAFQQMFVQMYMQYLA